MPFPGREECGPYLRQYAWSIRWSSGFLKSSATTLWSMYCTARETATRGTSSCSNCMKAIVPVASCSSVWSTRMPIGSPGLSSPSTRCSRRIRRVRFSAIVPRLPARRRVSRGRRAFADHLPRDDEHESGERDLHDALGHDVDDGDTGDRPGDGRRAEQPAVAQAHVAVAVLAPRADDRHRHDRQQRRRLGIDLVEPEEHRQRGDEEDAAADSEQAGEQSRERADDDRGDHLSARSAAATTSTTANSSRTVRTGTRCCSQVPAITPPTAGTPTSRPSSTCRLPYAPWASIAAPAMIAIATSDVPMARRSG